VTHVVTRCCAECFGDRGLRKSIIPSLEPTCGTCDYCGCVGVGLIEPIQLRDAFSPLIDIYQPDAGGKALAEWLKEDWQLFSHSSMDRVRTDALLCAIADDETIATKTFAPSPIYTSEGLARWETLREGLMYKNRYFPEDALDADRLRELLSYLHADDVPAKWYRARILAGSSPFLIDQMGAPDRRVASHGRANPSGIPYLYLSSYPNTAVAECRPHTGERACVADFTIAKLLTIVDLRNPRQLVSPFLLQDTRAIGFLRADIPFLERLGEELTRPVLPQAAAIDYVPSQYLCEFIKKARYDGVLYRSSVGDGMNLALFDPQAASGGAVELYHVNRVSVDIELCSSHAATPSTDDHLPPRGDPESIVASD